MLDWPDATQTSTTSTSLSVMVLVAFTIRENGPPASPGDKYRLQRPRSSAVSVLVSPRNVTAMLSPRVALPQTCTGIPRRRTMWAARSPGSVASAKDFNAETVQNKTTQPAQDHQRRFIDTLSTERLTAPSPESRRRFFRKSFSARPATP